MFFNFVFFYIVAGDLCKKYLKLYMFHLQMGQILLIFTDFDYEEL